MPESSRSATCTPLPRNICTEFSPYVAAVPAAATRSGVNRLLISPLPMWKWTAMPASCASDHSGSQWRSARTGSPKRCGSPVNRIPLWPSSMPRSDLGDSQVDVPVRRRHDRDEPARVGRRPVAQEVVVGAHAQDLELGVVDREELLAPEAGDVGVDDLGPRPDRIHVREAARRRRTPRGGSRRGSAARRGTASASPRGRGTSPSRSACRRGSRCRCRPRRGPSAGHGPGTSPVPATSTRPAAR